MKLNQQARRDARRTRAAENIARHGVSKYALKTEGAPVARTLASPVLPHRVCPYCKDTIYGEAATGQLPAVCPVCHKEF